MYPLLCNIFLQLKDGFFFSGHAKGEKFQTLPRQVQYLINRTSQNHETVLINSMSSFCLPLI